MLLWLTISCSEQGVLSVKQPDDGSRPEMVVEPRQLNFGLYREGDSSISRSFTIRNEGAAVLELGPLSLLADDGSYLLWQEGNSRSLDPGQSHEVIVLFEAQSVQDVDVVQVNSNDPQQQAAEVSLTGRGAYPELVIMPNPLVLDAVGVECVSERSLLLSNAGSEQLTIHNIQNPNVGAFSFYNPLTLPAALDPGQSTELRVFHQPITAGVAQASMTVHSNDPSSEQVVALQGEGLVERHEESWTTAVAPPSDILFSVDLSSSMSDEAQALGAQFETFITSLSSYTTDWQVMVVNADHGCNHSGILSESTPGYAETFASAAQSGAYDISFTEALLTAVTNGVEKTDAGECNEGFLRPGAMLHIIMLSDECEQSPNPGICGTQWQSYIDRITTQKGDPVLVRISAVAGDPPSGCGSPQTAEYGQGYYEAVQATGGVFLSICSDWTSPYSLSLLAGASVSQSSFELSYPALEVSIQVTIDGSTTTAWSYDSSTTTVSLQSPPPQGSEINISYNSAFSCE